MLSREALIAHELGHVIEMLIEIGEQAKIGVDMFKTPVEEWEQEWGDLLDEAKSRGDQRAIRWEEKVNPTRQSREHSDVDDTKRFVRLIFWASVLREQSRKDEGIGCWRVYAFCRAWC